MLITTFDAYLTPMPLGAVGVVHKSVNLKEPYSQGIKEKVATKNFLKKKKGLTWNPKPQRHSVLKDFFKFRPLFPICGVNKYTLITQVRINERETELKSTFETS